MGETGSKANLGGDGVRYCDGGSPRLLLKEVGAIAPSVELFECARRGGEISLAI